MSVVVDVAIKLLQKKVERKFAQYTRFGITPESFGLKSNILNYKPRSIKNIEKYANLLNDILTNNEYKITKAGNGKAFPRELVKELNREQRSYERKRGSITAGLKYHDLEQSNMSKMEKEAALDSYRNGKYSSAESLFGSGYKHRYIKKPSENYYGIQEPIETVDQLKKTIKELKYKNKNFSREVIQYRKNWYEALKTEYHRSYARKVKKELRDVSDKEFIYMSKNFKALDISFIYQTSDRDRDNFTDQIKVLKEYLRNKHAGKEDKSYEYFSKMWKRAGLK